MTSVAAAAVELWPVSAVVGCSYKVYRREPGDGTHHCSHSNQPFEFAETELPVAVAGTWCSRRERH